MTKHLFQLTKTKVQWGVLLAALLIFMGTKLFPVRSDDVLTPTNCQTLNGLNRFGVNEPLGWPSLYPPERLERSLSAMAEAGIGWVRLNWAWKDIQPEEHILDYVHLDDIARIAAEHQIEILPILMTVPAWSSTAPDELKAARGSLSPVDRYPPQDINDWLLYVHNAVERYDGDGVDDAPGSPRMNYWEVWNEPNIAPYWPPAPDAAEYLTFLTATHQAIKEADPTVTVVLGGLANAGFNGDGSNYLQALYNLDAAPYFDVVSIHIYSYPEHGAEPVVNVVESVRALMDANGDVDTPLWLTEIGWSDAPNAWGAPTVAQEDMAAYVTDVLSASLPVDLIFWYNFRNIFPNSVEVEHNFGLINADYTPKPAFEAYQRFSVECARQGDEGS